MRLNPQLLDDRRVFEIAKRFELGDDQDEIRRFAEAIQVHGGEQLMNEEVCVDDIAKLLEVSRKSAIQRMARLVKRHQAVRLSMPTVGNPARFRLLVSKQSLLHTQKFAGPKMNREIDWKKFCSDPFGLTKKVRE
jgi:hypothetical protein